LFCYWLCFELRLASMLLLYVEYGIWEYGMAHYHLQSAICNSNLQQWWFFIYLCSFFSSFVWLDLCLFAFGDVCVK
jgi:hypothetical protein